MASKLFAWLSLFLCLLTENKGDNVTSNEEPVNSVDTYIPKKNDECTNECSSTNPYYWCGNMREDATGQIMRCRQYTRYTGICVDECGGKGKSYDWCLTNAHTLQRYHWWDYCSLLGYTINKEPCTDRCAPRGEKYWWCHTKSNWDYCSPPGDVAPVQLTIKGDVCKSECGRHGKSYYWCKKSMKYCDTDTCGSDCLDGKWCKEHGVYCVGESDCEEQCRNYYDPCDDDWDYCSLDGQHTRFHQPCDGPCAKKGKSYYWCDTKGGSWDYCSPTAQFGVHFSEKTQLTIYGVKCRDICGKGSNDYYWCKVYGRSHWNTWDYCSPHRYKTRYGERCKDACNSKGKSYYWCYTDSSWDYCSPDYKEGMVGYESLTAGGDTVQHQITGISAILVLCYNNIFI